MTTRTRKTKPTRQSRYISPSRPPMSMAASRLSSRVIVGAPGKESGEKAADAANSEDTVAVLHHSICWSIPQISRFLIRVGMPHNIIWQPKHLISSSFGHLGKAFRLRLVFECVTRKVDPYVMDDEYRNVRQVMPCQNKPDLCTSAFTSIFTPPIPSNATSSSLFFRQSPMAKRYSRPVSYSLYPVHY